MKKAAVVGIGVAVAIALAACGSDQPSEDDADQLQAEMEAQLDGSLHFEPFSSLDHTWLLSNGDRCAIGTVSADPTFIDANRETPGLVVTPDGEVGIQAVAVVGGSDGECAAEVEDALADG